MTIDEFKKTGFGANMRASYRGHIYNLTGCNFIEALIELTGEDGEPLWARCENVELIKENTNEIIYKHNAL